MAAGYLLNTGKFVILLGLPRRADRTRGFPDTLTLGVYDGEKAVQVIDMTLKQVLARLKQASDYEWRSIAESDNSGLGARIAKIQKQLFTAIRSVEGKIFRQAFPLVVSAKAFATGVIRQQQSMAIKQLQLDAADLVWCCLMDDIEAVHYDLSCIYGEQFVLGDAVLYTNKEDGIAVTVWEFVAWLESVHKTLTSTKLVAALNRSRIPVEQRRPMFHEYNGAIRDYQLGLTYN